MLRIFQHQIDTLDADCFRRAALAFVAGEYALYGPDGGSPQVSRCYDDLCARLQPQGWRARLLLVQILLAACVFPGVFSAQSVTQLLSLEASTEQRSVMLERALLACGYDAEFLRRQTWV